MRCVGVCFRSVETIGVCIDMELVANIVGLIVVAVIAAIVIGFSNKYARKRMGGLPAMGKLNVPCDPALHSDFLNALSGEKIQFVPPTQAESSSNNSGNTQDSPMCVVLVAEKDYARAERILVGFQQKWSSRK
jgi:hypothetical protein